MVLALLFLAVPLIAALLSPHASRKCQVCSGQGCKGHVGLTECGDPSDLCMATVENRQDGTQIYSKKCATRNECNEKWLKETTLKAECIGFHPDSTYRFNFNCTFCCKRDGCNIDNKPAVDTLYLKTEPRTKPVTAATTTEATHGTTIAPMMCEVCDGSFCGLFPQTQVTCPRNAPYCMNSVDNDDIANKMFTKKCASFYECQTRWWEGSSDLAVCTGFDVRTPYYYKFQCVYCCTKSGCNADIYPERSTLFKGRD